MILIVPILVPLLAAFLHSFLPQAVRAPAIGFVLVTHILSSALLLYSALHGDVSGTIVGGWPIQLGIRLQADVLSSAMLLVTGILFLTTFIWRLCEPRPSLSPSASLRWEQTHDIDVAPDPDAFDLDTMELEPSTEAELETIVVEEGSESSVNAPARNASRSARPTPTKVPKIPHELLRPRAPEAGLLALLAACSGAYLTRDLFNLYVWFEVLLVSTLLIIAVETGDKGRPAWRGYLTINLLSSILFILGIAFVFAKTGVLDFSAIQQAAQGQTGGTWAIGAGLLASAFFVKAASFPAGIVLGQTYPELRWPTAALFAGLLTKVGVYSFLRLQVEILPEQLAVAAPILLAIACISMIFGALGAMTTRDVGVLLGYMVVSQVGYLLMGVTLGSNEAMVAVIFNMLHHMLINAALYFGVGLGELAIGNRSLDAYHGVLQKNKFAAILLALAILSLAGLPFSSGFWAKLLLIRSAVLLEAWLAVAVAIFVAALTLYLLARLWQGMFATGTEDIQSVPPCRTARLQTWRRRGLLVPCIILVVFSTWVGLQPRPLWSLAEIATEQITNASRPTASAQTADDTVQIAAVAPATELPR